ncbi:MAG: Acetyltransferase [uncultured Thermomicrobiales bacterium]|uniref:Acetyltransferase n=1 Tax=uncultured Thermomicrobiales bacterium TaxID=1645740 RepID=A0A6J4UKJ9_9BACT|nr:MAG: Acetyltransferase [uncultured Thermomicrobiales bacterium]
MTATPSSGDHATRVRPPSLADFEDWGRLYAAYAGFYGNDQTPAARDLVWGWIHDPHHEVSALLLLDEGGSPVGLAHYRPFARPLAAGRGCYLEDLYVDPAHRGGGGASALLAELRRLARINGWSVVRWITADDNYRARSLYDRVATRTGWITYDMSPDDAVGV